MTPEIIALISGATIGLVSVIKGMFLPKDESSVQYQNRIRFVPAIGLVVAVALTFILGKQHTGALAVQGIIIGLTAMGFYSAAKTTVGK